MGPSTELRRSTQVLSLVAMFLPSCSGTVLLKELEMPPAQISAALLAIDPKTLYRKINAYGIAPPEFR